MKNLAASTAFVLSTNPEFQSGIVAKQAVKPVAMPQDLNENTVANVVSLAISRSRAAVNAIQKALAFTVLHAQATGDIRQIGRLINGLSGSNMRPAFGYLEEFAPCLIEKKGKGYAVTYNADMRWTNDVFREQAETCLVKNYLDYAPLVQDTPIDTNKLIVALAAKIASRIIEPVEGDHVDIDQAKHMLEYAQALTTDVKQLAKIDLALNELAKVDDLEGELASEIDALEQHIEEGAPVAAAS